MLLGSNCLEFTSRFFVFIFQLPAISSMGKHCIFWHSSSEISKHDTHILSISFESIDLRVRFVKVTRFALSGYIFVRCLVWKEKIFLRGFYNSKKQKLTHFAVFFFWGFSRGMKDVMFKMLPESFVFRQFYIFYSMRRL